LFIEGVEHSALYAQFRPVAPPSLIEEVLAQFPGDDLEGRLFFQENAIFYFNAVKPESQ
jgi:hypothetical protein